MADETKTNFSFLFVETWWYGVRRWLL